MLGWARWVKRNRGDTETQKVINRKEKMQGWGKARKKERDTLKERGKEGGRETEKDKEQERQSEGRRKKRRKRKKEKETGAREGRGFGIETDRHTVCR